VAGYRGRHVFGLDAIIVKDLLDGERYRQGIHDGAIHHRVLAQGLDPQVDQFVKLEASRISRLSQRQQKLVI